MKYYGNTERSNVLFQLKIKAELRKNLVCRPTTARLRFSVYKVLTWL